jgi:hypothetical protein
LPEGFIAFDIFIVFKFLLISAPSSPATGFVPSHFPALSVGVQRQGGVLGLRFYRHRPALEMVSKCSRTRHTRPLRENQTAGFLLRRASDNVAGAN